MVLLSPFVVAFVYPVVMLIMMYGAAVFLHVYRHRRREIFDAYSENYWDGAMQTVAAVFDAHGSLWHGKKNNFSHEGISCKCFAKLILNSRQVSWVRVLPLLVCAFLFFFFFADFPKTVVLAIERKQFLFVLVIYICSLINRLARQP